MYVWVCACVFMLVNVHVCGVCACMCVYVRVCVRDRSRGHFDHGSSVAKTLSSTWRLRDGVKRLEDRVL